MKLSKDTALKTILVIATAGILFSGYLSYKEIVTSAGTCSAAAGAPCALFGVPVCIYGLAMYLLVFVLAWFGMSSKG